MFDTSVSLKLSLLTMQSTLPPLMLSPAITNIWLADPTNNRLSTGDTDYCPLVDNQCKRVTFGKPCDHKATTLTGYCLLHASPTTSPECKRKASDPCDLLSPVKKSRSNPVDLFPIFKPLKTDIKDMNTTEDLPTVEDLSGVSTILIELKESKESKAPIEDEIDDLLSATQSLSLDDIPEGDDIKEDIIESKESKRESKVDESDGEVEVIQTTPVRRSNKELMIEMSEDMDIKSLKEMLKIQAKILKRKMQEEIDNLDTFISGL